MIICFLLHNKVFLSMLFVVPLTPVTAVQSKRGTYASPHLHGETGPLLAGGMVHRFQQKGGVFKGGSPWILKKGADFTI